MSRKMIWARGIRCLKVHQPRFQNWAKIYKERPNIVGAKASPSLPQKYEDEEANLRLMADIEYEYEHDEEVNFNNLEYLRIAYQELLSNFSTLSLGYKELKRKFSKLTKDF
ncbi:hypothetical protein CR513_01531, partial [Mucuna pruriens]